MHITLQNEHMIIYSNIKNKMKIFLFSSENGTYDNHFIIKLLILFK